jgi:uncharacterized protein YjbJ (UPF0337 family)
MHPRHGEQSNQSETSMNWDRVQGNWKQFKGKVKEQWGKLTDDQLDIIAGKREQLAGRVQEVYGVSREEAERQITEFEDRNRDWTPDAGRIPPNPDSAARNAPPRV